MFYSKEINDGRFEPHASEIFSILILKQFYIILLTLLDFNEKKLLYLRIILRSVIKLLVKKLVSDKNYNTLLTTTLTIISHYNKTRM